MDVTRFHDKRGDVERTISETKNDLSIDHVPTSSLGANESGLALEVLAHDVLMLCEDCGLRLQIRLRVATLRRRLLAIAGRVVRDAGPLVLRLSPHTPLRTIAAARPRFP